MAQALALVLAVAVTNGLVPQRRAATARTPMRMGWGDPPVWSDATVVSNDEAATGMRAITLEVPAATAEAHAVGGQYVQLTGTADEKAGFYAIASPPGAGRFEFLVKETENNGHLTGAKSGATLKCSEVDGKGYQTAAHFSDGDAAANEYDGFACMNVLFAACGSGIAPIRSAIEAGVALQLPKPATLYYGARDPAMMAYADRFDLWKDWNVQVRPCFSRADAPPKGAFAGYVQAAIAADGVDVPRNTGACVCGPKEMYEAVKETLTGAGVFEGRVLSNF